MSPKRPGQDPPPPSPPPPPPSAPVPPHPPTGPDPQTGSQSGSQRPTTPTAPPRPPRGGRRLQSSGARPCSPVRPRPTRGTEVLSRGSLPSIGFATDVLLAPPSEAPSSSPLRTRSGLDVHSLPYSRHGAGGGGIGSGTCFLARGLETGTGVGTLGLEAPGVLGWGRGQGRRFRSAWKGSRLGAAHPSPRLRRGPGAGDASGRGRTAGPARGGGVSNRVSVRACAAGAEPGRRAPRGRRGRRRRRWSPLPPRARRGSPRPRPHPAPRAQSRAAAAAVHARLAPRETPPPRPWRHARRGRARASRWGADPWARPRRPAPVGGPAGSQARAAARAGA